jgi:GT2 family glycosyltransferase
MYNVIVIIASYNGMKWLPECLESVVNSSVPVTIVVVDNNSKDDSVIYIKENYGTIILLEQESNLGFGRANNIGMGYALNQNADFVFLLNQDAFVEINTIEKLINTSRENEGFGILSPVQLDYSGTSLETYFHKFMANTATKSFYSDYVLSKILKDIYEVPFIQAASWLLPITTLKKIGGFDPIFFHYGEDDNYCQRVIFHNMKIGVVPEAFIRHDSNVNIKPLFPLFSNSYFLNYERKLYVKYGNLNYDFTHENIKAERKNAYKLIVFGFVGFSLFKIKGGVKQLFALNKFVENILKSREMNSNNNTHYI